MYKKGAANRVEEDIYVYIQELFFPSSPPLSLVGVQEASSSELLSVNVLLYNDWANGLVADYCAPGQGVVATGYRHRATAVGVSGLDALGVVVALYYALPASSTLGCAGETDTTAAFVSPGSSRLGRLSGWRGGGRGRLGWC